MASDRRLTFPKEAMDGLRSLVALDDGAFDALEDALNNASPSLRFRDLVLAVTERINQSTIDFESIVRVLLSLSTVRTQSKVNVADFAQDILSALRNSDDPALRPSGEGWEILEAKIVRLLSIKSVCVTAKALAVMTEHPNVFLSDDSRVLSDIRLIFSEDPIQRASDGVIVHVLKIGHVHDGNHAEFFVALDSQDIIDLQDILARAQQKEKHLKAVMEDAGVAYLDPRKG
jgi:hypothetical protein